MAKIRATAGQILINEILPTDMQDYSRKLDKKGLANLLSEIAEKHPEKYRDVSFRLGVLGRKSAYATGGFSFGLEHMLRARSAIKRREVLQKKLDAVLDDDNIDDAKRDKKTLALVGKLMEEQPDEILQESRDEGNPLALQLEGAGRGNKMNLASLRGSDGLYQDHRGNIIPIPVLRSYAQGLSPLEYWASTYGARQGVMALKFCLAADTPVLTEDFSSRKISDIRRGDVVWAAGKDGRLVRTTVKNVFANGERHCFEFFFREGRTRSFVSVTASGEHRVQTCWRTSGGVQQDMVPLGDLKTRKHSAVAPDGICGSDGIPETRAGLIGLLLGDGGLTQQNTNFYCADPTSVRCVAEIAAHHNLEPVLTSDAVGSAPRYTLQEIVRSSGVGGGVRSPFRAWLAELGMLGKAAPDKKLPDQVWNWDRKSCGELVSWLLETDGCFTTAKNQQGLSYPVVSFYVTSRKLAEGLRKLLQIKLGIFSGPVKVRPVKGQVSRFRRADGTWRYANRNHDLHGFLISRRAAVNKLAVVWVNSGSKSDAFQLAVSSHSAKNNTDLPRGYVRCEDRGMLATYDLEVEHESHCFTLANGLVVSNSTQDAGFLSKQLNQIAHRAMVMADDDDVEPETLQGLPVDTDDDDSEGSLLAAPAGDHKRNTVLTPKIIRELREKGIKRILVRSPAVSGTPDGGLYARDVGVREFGRLPTRGENVGLAAAQALTEPISQSQMAAKHSGGVAGQSQAVSGFDFINQLVQVPKTFKGGAAHATVDGIVQAVEPAPAGGSYVVIDGTKHYVGTGYEPNVKRGDRIEAGDTISDGTPNPALITKYKGIGEGRRYFVNAFTQAIRDGGMQAHRRNVELLARGLINHVRLTDEIGDFAPDDIVPYSILASHYKPRDGHRTIPPTQAVGRYLEKPYLHYSVGTRVQPNMLKEFKTFGVGEVSIHDDPPPFEPEMIRGMSNLQHDPDWMTRMFGSGLKSSLLRGVHRGATSSEVGTSFVPARAKAVNFGRVGVVRTPTKPVPGKP